MAQSRVPGNRSDVDPTVDEVFDALDEVLEFFPEDAGSTELTQVTIHTEAELAELRNDLRVTIERLEIEAAQMRWQLEQLEVTTKPAWYH